jgi:hypothetical protein
MFNPLARTGRVIGSDFAGIIDFLGDAVPAASGLEVGLPVAGFLKVRVVSMDVQALFKSMLSAPGI